MSQTKIEALINHLRATFADGSDVGGYKLQVVDGGAAADVRNNVLFIGHSIYQPSYAGTASQEWATLGNLTRKEQLEVACSLRVAIGNKDMAGCRQRAIAVFEAIAFAFRGSLAALTANGEFQQISLSRYRLYQEYSGDGVSVTIEFTVSAIARV